MNHYISTLIRGSFLLKLAGVFLALPYCATAQLPASVIEIQGRILEHGSQQARPLPNIEVWINSKSYISDRIGNFSLKVPYSDERIKLNIRPNGYRILKPFNGELQLDPSVTIFQLEIFVIQQSIDDELLETVDRLESKLAQSQRDHKFSQRQLSRMNEVLLDTLVFFDRQKQAYVDEIENLHAKLKQSEVSVNELEERVKEAEAQIFTLEQQVDLLSEQLYQALEEKYLRQQAIYDQVSGALNNYLLRLKDMNDVLLRLHELFPMNYSPSGSQTYNTTVEAYNEVFSLLNEKKDEFLLGVNHYWESEDIGSSLVATYDLLFERIHKEQLLPGLTQINGDLRLRKRKAAIKTGEQTSQNLVSEIERLELAIQETILLMKYNI